MFFRRALIWVLIITASLSSIAAMEELECLASIYGDEFHKINAETFSIDFFFNNTGKDCNLNLTASLTVIIPSDYPMFTSPTFNLVATSWFSIEISDCITNELIKMFKPGEAMLYSAIESLRDQLEALASDVSCSVAAVDVDTSATILEDDVDVEIENPINVFTAETVVDSPPCITTGTTVTERKSIFQAHVAAIKDTSEADTVVALLKTNKKIASATHNIVAYRIKAHTGFVQDYDDDGESAAGKRLLHLLELLDAKNVIVIVSRWYGGIKLGPERFKLINNTARKLLQEAGYVDSVDSEKKTTKKKR